MRKYALSRTGNPGNQGLLLALFPVLLLFFSGCAGKLPVTAALTGEEKQDALALLQQVREHSCPDFFDADLILNWQGYGQHRIVNATMQATRKGAFRLSGLDPLGRPFFILVTDGTRFTLVDNLQGRGYTGAVESDFLGKYIPVGLKLTTCFSFLAAQVPAKEIPLVRFARTDKNNSFWFVFTLEDGMTQQAEIDPVRGRLVRQVFVDADNSILLDVRYDRYQSQPQGCDFPVDLSAEGKDLSGSLQVTFSRVYQGSQFPEDLFKLNIPDHFVLTEVE